MKKRHFTNEVNSTSFVKSIFAVQNLLKYPAVIFENQGLLGPSSAARYISSLNFTSGPERILKNILLDHIYSADKTAPLSGFLSLTMLDNEEKQQKFSRISYSDAWDETLKFVVNNRSRQILNVLKKYKPLGTISVTKGHRTHDTIEFKNGYTSRCRPEPRFMEQIKKSSIVLNDVSILMIEGAPSSVSELNYFLKNCYENKNHAIIIARSFPEEVIATLSINWNRQSLMVVPLIYGHDVFSINSLRDLQCIVGGLPYTNSLNDKLGKIDKSRLGYADKINIGIDKIVFNATPKNLEPHKNSLLERLETTESIDKIEIINQRLCDFNNNGIEISLKDSDDIIIIFEELNNLIRYHSSLCKFGFINYCNWRVPKNTYDSAKKASQIFLKNLESIGGFLYIPDPEC